MSPSHFTMNKHGFSSFQNVVNTFKRDKTHFLIKCPCPIIWLIFHRRIKGLNRQTKIAVIRTASPGGIYQSRFTRSTIHMIASIFPAVSDPRQGSAKDRQFNDPSHTSSLLAGCRANVRRTNSQTGTVL